METDDVHVHAATNIISAEAFTQHEYDYLILGGGTAGLTIAARLSEDGDVMVGVIEAGKNRLGDRLVNVPALGTQMLGNAEYDWDYRTTPQIAASGPATQQFPGGKMLGGTSALNMMMYARGSDTDYDDWAKIVEDDSWSSSNMKQYMRKHQTLEPIDESILDHSMTPFIGENHGSSGPIYTSFNPWKLDIEEDVVKAANKVGDYESMLIDPWGGDHNGFYHGLAAISRSGAENGRRSYSAKGYLERNFDRPNLKVTTKSLVTKIEIHGTSATGASYRSHDQEHFVKARREVVVCAGVVGSPQLLELSGIGNPEVLSNVGVECKIENRAIGENLQDHVLTSLCPFVNDGVEGLEILQQPDNLARFQQMYAENQTGPLSCTIKVQGFFPYKKFATDQELAATIASIQNIEAGSPFVKKQRETIITHLKDEKSANLQLVFAPVTTNMKVREKDPDNTTEGTPGEERRGVTLVVCLQFPVSRGSVHIRSPNPEDHPAIDPAYLTHEADLNVLATGLKFLHLLTEAEPFASKLNGERSLPRTELDLMKTTDARQAVLEWYKSSYHAVGSVAMGDALDSRLRVKGVDRLRVADASVFPGHVSGNIMSTVYMVGERAADIIKEDWDSGTLRMKP